MAPVVIGSSPLDFPPALLPQNASLPRKHSPCCCGGLPAAFLPILPVFLSSCRWGELPCWLVTLPCRAGSLKTQQGTLPRQQGTKFINREANFPAGRLFLPAGRVFCQQGSLFLRLGTKKLRRIRSFLADTITFRL